MSITRVRKALHEKQADEYDPTLYKEGWDLKKVMLATKRWHGYNIDTIYNFNEINEEYLRIKESKEFQQQYWDKDYTMSDLDEAMWEEFTDTLEDARRFIFETCVEYGANEVESYFLSVKWSRSTLKKFRNKFFHAMDGKKDKKDYDRTALKESVNTLIRKFEAIMAPANFIYSRNAINTANFRKQASWDIARELAEDIGVILHAKLTL